MKVDKATHKKSMTILIDGLSHIVIADTTKTSIQSYIDERDKGRPYKIDFHLPSGIMTCEYDSRDKWEQILKLL